MAINKLHGLASSGEAAYFAASEIHNEPAWLMHPRRNTRPASFIV
jgi:hypothetical protein